MARWERELRAQASLQYGCSDADIVVLAEDGNRMGRRVRLDVCGTDRLYEQYNAGATFEWRETTRGASDGAPYTVP
jgi:hypothetical protein